MTRKLPERYDPDSVGFIAYLQDVDGVQLDRVAGIVPRHMVWDWLRDWRASVTQKYGALAAVDVNDEGGHIRVLATLAEGSHGLVA